MTIYELKPQFQNLLRPIVHYLHTNGVTPNQITWSALILSALMGSSIAFTQGNQDILLWVPLVMLIRMALNAIDGLLAREFNMQTDSGAMLNEMTDVIADAMLYLPLAFMSGVNVTWLVLFVLLGILTEMAGVVAQVIGGQRRYDGPMGKSDRAFVFALLCLLLGFGVQPGLWLDLVLLSSTLLAALTVYRRTHGALS